MPELTHSRAIESALSNAIENAMRRLAPAICLRIAELAMEELEHTLDHDRVKAFMAEQTGDAPARP